MFCICFVLLMLCFVFCQAAIVSFPKRQVLRHQTQTVRECKILGTLEDDGVDIGQCCKGVCPIPGDERVLVSRYWQVYCVNACTCTVSAFWIVFVTVLV